MTESNPFKISSRNKKITNKNKKYIIDLDDPHRKSPSVKELKRAFSLRFKGKYKMTTDRTLQIIAKTITKFSKQTQELDIDCSECKGITDDGIFSISKSLRRLIYLETLRMNFSGCCYDLTDDALYFLSEGLKNLRHLQRISMNFTACYEFREKGLRYLCQGLKKHYDLKDIRLEFAKFKNLKRFLGFIE